MTWSAQQYRKFEDERTRPARDLLQAVPLAGARRTADLGCGPGNSTGLLVARFPEASIVGIDNSENMLKAARERLPSVHFELADIGQWNGQGVWDLIFSNAALQWVGGHEKLLPALAGQLAPGGVLAIQMPDNLGEPSHVAMNTVAQSAAFAAKLAAAGGARTAIGTADWYYALLKQHCARVEIWHTTYYHPLAGGLGAIVEWLKGTGLTPFLEPLSAGEREDFLTAYELELAKCYTPLADGTVILPFPRLFAVAVR
jgi:trans-aconitate 2-methyltransferase